MSDKKVTEMAEEILKAVKPGGEEWKDYVG